MATVTFQTMPRAAGTDSADMPHILGDPVDVNWQGVAERCNSNFAAFNTWAGTVASALNGSVATGTAVLTPSAGWTIGHAIATTYPFLGGRKLVILDLSLRFTGSTVALVSGTTGVLTTVRTMATVQAAFVPSSAVKIFYKVAGRMWSYSTTYAPQALDVGCGLYLTSAAVLAVDRLSAPNLRADDGWVNAVFPYLITTT